jgi:peptide/nickel transport system substrate-binding protein
VTARRVLVGLLVAVAVLGVSGSASAQDEKVVLTIGLTNDVDTLNPVVGVEVPDYEVWNMMYATLTDKDAADFHTIPGLAESWEASDDGLTYTYTLREGLKWSDGQPLTAEDVAYTVNRSREEAWLNYSSTTGNITATAPDERTVVLTSSVPDPKLPTMDVYIVPKHIFEKQNAKQITKYQALEGVGSGPFVIRELKRGQFWRLEANPNYWAGAPAVDEVVFRLFTNQDAMVAALLAGEIDAIHDVPTNSFKQLEETEGIVAVQGQQGGFEELAINGGQGLKKPHPALMDIRVRQAIAHAIDDEALIDRVLVGLGTPTDAMSPSANPAFTPEIPEDDRFDFDLDEARQILDDAGYMDTNGDGVREMPGGGRPLDFVYAVRTESQTAPGVAEFVTGWLNDIGIKITQKPMNDAKLTEEIGKGNYDMFHWGWTPFVDPDPMLSYFVCDQLSKDPDNPTNYYNDANWCDPEYDRLYQEQKVELDPDRRMEIIHEMLTIFHDSATYNVLFLSPDLQAYRTDRFTGWLRQPAEIGPVLFSNTSPTYANLELVSESEPEAAAAGGGEDDGGSNTGMLVALGVAVLAAAAVAVWLLRRRRTADERE